MRDRVTSEDIATVVARSTGIPVQNLLKGEKEKLIHVSRILLIEDDMRETLTLSLSRSQMEDSLKTRVVGQDHVVTA